MLLRRAAIVSCAESASGIKLSDTNSPSVAPYGPDEKERYECFERRGYNQNYRLYSWDSGTAKCCCEGKTEQAHPTNTQTKEPSVKVVRI
jgi:hypothetical protein